MFGIGDDDDGDQCPTHNLTARAKKTFIAGLTFQEFNRILAGACTALACLVSFVHMWRHATHLSVPRQQVKVMRVISLVPLYAIVNFLCICFPQAQVYLDPILELIQALCLASYFMLLCEYISPHNEGRDGFFSQIEIKDKKAEGGVVQDGVKWFAQRCVMIFQYPVIALGVAIATIITQVAGVYCQYESQTNFAKLWLSIATTLSSGMAIAAVLLVAVQLKTHMPNLKPMTKLIAIKLVVGLAFLQQILFWILQSTHVLKETDTLTYADLHYGIPSLLSCLEMVPISFVVFWAYPVGPYKLEHLVARGAERGEAQNWAPTSYQGGILGIYAFISMLNPFDVIKATFAAFAVGARDYASAKFDRNDSGGGKVYATGPGYQQPPTQYRQDHSYGGGQSRGPAGLAREALNQFGPGRHNGRNGYNNNGYGRQNGRGYDHTRGNSYNEYHESYPMNQRR
ncbi:hypothetical protein ISF_08965 [Cordyceps fumosorosea ARSEF 2679]|uniref:Transmembrane protein n=1 Tax=Cordyceps fumosorosea (strain ARSEF 2679) TaxID=1081104 RepID=A0A167LIE5_CORFA|nr:hypothetical protein ISF_08965 [Cordyceps fumosorosea ARSEF 2679]OAA53124.1 hypothetical protein ISF_08965 [Cordyceps fumosorosea ARSEF 2679]